MSNISATLALKKPEYPFPSLISKWAADIEEDTKSWITNDFSFLPQKLQEKYKLSNFGKISARCFPEMKTYKHLQSAARFMLWATIFDDFYEFASVADLQKLHAEVLRILDGGEPKTNYSPFLPILAGLKDDIRRIMPSQWMSRFKHNVSIWIASMQEEVPYKVSVHFPPLAYFMELRERTIGVQAYLDLIEMQLPDSIPDQVMNSDYMKNIYRLAARIFAWCNDFYSLLKDTGREPLNLILVVLNEDATSLEFAHRRAMEIHDEDVAQLTAAINNISDFAKHTSLVSRFLDLLKIMVQGQNDWYKYDTLRYDQNGYPVKGSFDKTKSEFTR